MQTKIQSNLSQTYRIAPHWAFAYIALAAFPALPAILIGLKMMTSLFSLPTSQIGLPHLCAWVYIVILVLCAAMIFSRVIFVRVITSPKGIEYHDVGFSIYTPWSNVEKIGLVKAPWGKEVLWGGGIECLILNRPMPFQGSKLLARLFWYRTKMENRIPLIEFGHWRYSDLGKDIKRYAPHLFIELPG